MRRRPLLAAGGRLAAAALATVAGLAAVRVIGDGITSSTGTDVLTPREAARQLASASALPSPAADPAPGPSGSPTPSRSPGPSGASAEVSPSGATPPASPGPARKVATTPGGTVVAECHGALVTLKSWAPAQGYGVKKAEPGPDEHAEVSFEGAAGRVEIRWRCADGRPVASWKTDD
ncbi:hypothetical protein [Streptomyces sp. NPDC056600]|uniref:hypothetical protein n=1 Tax=Streptomyces sp. NPDC056600 TaxID=3345874 RepID=UPI0036AB7891